MGALSHSLWDLLSPSLSTQLIVRLIVTDFTHHALLDPFLIDAVIRFVSRIRFLSSTLHI